MLISIIQIITLLIQGMAITILLIKIMKWIKDQVKYWEIYLLITILPTYQMNSTSQRQKWIVPLIEKGIKFHNQLALSKWSILLINP